MESNDNLQDLVRGFLKQHKTYDVLPVSYRLIVLDTQLLVKKALAALMQNGKLGMIMAVHWPVLNIMLPHF